MTAFRHSQETTEDEGMIVPAGPRRIFFIRMIRLIPSVIGLSLVVPLLGYVGGPAFRRRVDSWTAIGKVADLPSGEPQELEYTSTIKDGWRTTSAKKGVRVSLGCAGQTVSMSLSWECVCRDRKGPRRTGSPPLGLVAHQSGAWATVGDVQGF